MEISRALVIEEVEHLKFRDLPKPEIKDYEVLFKTKYCSLCTVDRRTYKGTRKKKLPFLGGHECSGIVEKVGTGVVGVQPGDKVVFTSGYCMQCDLDRTNKGTQCQNKGKMPKRAVFDGTILGGGLSEYLAIPAWQIIKLPDEVNLKYTCLTEPLACCVHSIRKARIKMTETVVIIGLGIMGYFHLKLARMQGARVIVSETDPVRQKRALEYGAYAVLDPNTQDVILELQKMTNGLGADVVVNTIPAASVWESTFDMLAPYGRLIAYSSQDEKKGIPVDFGMVHGREIEIIGTLNPTLEDNNIATKLISYEMIDMSQVIDEVYSFDQGKEAFDKACEPGMYRVLIEY